MRKLRNNGGYWDGEVRRQKLGWRWKSEREWEIKLGKELSKILVEKFWEIGINLRRELAVKLKVDEIAWMSLVKI